MAKFKLGNVKRGGLYALLSALLFGASTPAAKAIIGGVDPLMLAGLLYMGSGCGVAIVRFTALKQAGLALKRADLPWLAATVLFGGALGPALLMVGLTSTSGAAASLLLTLEGVFTAVIAWVVFKEPFNRRIGWGMLAIFLGAVVLALRGPGGHTGFIGALAVSGACLCWAIDNNCTSKISLVDAPTLASIKGIVAGIANVTLALIVGAHLPPMATAGFALIIGLLGYGASLVLFVFALREIGAARTGAYYSTAPFIGAAIGLVLLREPWSLSLLIASGLMALGVWLHLTEPPEADVK
ncbi:DMT family transporter [Asticcacaulis sp. EMRT-3]|uniref:DMT family transporter n=1 Tax=Asticcacaulis sp. EMRT-3 TaxID=3040349 RepID=UPI0024AE90E8|nr:DMT family transporter [Asticcacaulis sp. EMRT-3]MDI7776616.1 DMT family transporter [Asticcacaulis sp. EMRT-3]